MFYYLDPPSGQFFELGVDFDFETRIATIISPTDDAPTGITADLDALRAIDTSKAWSLQDGELHGAEQRAALANKENQSVHIKAYNRGSAVELVVVETDGTTLADYVDRPRHRIFRARAKNATIVRLIGWWRPGARS